MSIVRMAERSEVLIVALELRGAMRSGVATKWERRMEEPSPQGDSSKSRRLEPARPGSRELKFAARSSRPIRVSI